MKKKTNLQKLIEEVGPEPGYALAFGSTQTTSEWFENLTQQEQKKLIALLFELRPKLNQQSVIYNDLLKHLDDEYHALKLRKK